MQSLSLSLASRAYDGIMPIVLGEVGIPGVDVRARLDSNVPRVFAALYKGEVDMSEMSLAELIYYTTRGKADFVAIPVFTSRVFRHGFLFVSTESGIAGPADLNGRRIGFQRWVQTAGVWMRGNLVDDYGVSPAETSWYVSSTHHWEDHEGEDIAPRDGAVIRRYATPGKDGLEPACQALLEGEIDAIGITENQAPALLASGRARRLFEDHQAEETAYFQRTRIFPIMHVLAMRRELAEAHPGLPGELFELFSRSKRLAQAAARNLPSWALAWKERYVDDERRIFEGDLWPFGLAANRHVVETFIRYCWQQGIAARHIEAAELFVPSTRELTEAELAA
ncbi:MAG TPA: PhnD/SsuA/transferrin family substrate-binding protein [Chloroflexota bacterium]